MFDVKILIFEKKIKIKTGSIGNQNLGILFGNQKC